MPKRQQHSEVEDGSLGSGNPRKRLRLSLSVEEKPDEKEAKEDCAEEEIKEMITFGIHSANFNGRLQVSDDDHKQEDNTGLEKRTKSEVLFDSSFEEASGYHGSNTNEVVLEYENPMQEDKEGHKEFDEAVDKGANELEASPAGTEDSTAKPKKLKTRSEFDRELAKELGAAYQHVLTLREELPRNENGLRKRFPWTVVTQAEGDVEQIPDTGTGGDGPNAAGANDNEPVLDQLERLLLYAEEQNHQDAIPVIMILYQIMQEHAENRNVGDAAENDRAE